MAVEDESARSIDGDVADAERVGALGRDGELNQVHAHELHRERHHRHGDDELQRPQAPVVHTNSPVLGARGRSGHVSSAQTAVSAPVHSTTSTAGSLCTLSNSKRPEAAYSRAV